jgi:DNA invertase Pin-like site-specific DNA recombinase
MKHLIEIITERKAKGVGFRSITENIDTTTSGGRLIFPFIWGAGPV